MELNTPNLAQAEMTRTFPDAPWLAHDDKVPFVTLECRAGGYLNAPLQAAIEALNIKRDVDDLELKRLADDPEAYVKFEQASMRRDALGRLGAVLDTCVESWSTNIESDGALIDPTPENLRALSRAFEPHTSKMFRELMVFVNDLSGFIVARDADAVKN